MHDRLWGNPIKSGERRSEREEPVTDRIYTKEKDPRFSSGGL